MLPPSPSLTACEAAAADAHGIGIAWHRVLQALQAGDARQRTLGALLAAPSEAGEPLQAWAAGVLAAAHASNDAQALRWAQAACAPLADANDCRRALAQARVAAEPGNAVHWADLAALDPAQEAQSWEGLATATSWQERPQAWRAGVEAAFDPGWPPALRHALSARAAALLGEEAAAAARTLLDTACLHWGPAHPRGRACDHAARLMVLAADSPAAIERGLALLREDTAEPSLHQTGQARLRQLAAQAAAPVCAAQPRR